MSLSRKSLLETYCKRERSEPSTGAWALSQVVLGLPSRSGARTGLWWQHGVYSAD